MRVDADIDLFSIDDVALTAILAARYRNCGKNMPHAAPALHSIAARLLAALDAQGVLPAQRAGRQAFYRGELAMRPSRRGGLPHGGLVPFVRFRFGDDGYRLFVESLETALVKAGTPEGFLVDVFKTPPATFVEGLWTRRWWSRAN